MAIIKKNLIYLLFGSVSCSSIMGDSKLDGSNYQEIVDYETRNGNIAVEPDYQQLGLTTSEKGVKTVKVGIFITYDGLVKKDGVGSENDNGAKAYEDLKKWFKVTADAGGLLEPDLDTNQDGKPDSLKEVVDLPLVDGNPLLRQFKVKGYGRDIWRVSSEIYWDITVTLGFITHIHRRFGASIAENDLTMINGHFYKDEVGSSNNNANFMQQFFGGPEKKGIYPEAMESFESSIKATSGSAYKIVVVNGCKSEAIEELVISSVKKINQGRSADKALHIDMVGHRGFSNFNHFGPQISSFISGLVKNETSTGATDWKQLISALKFDAVADPATLKHDPTLNKVEPVLRRYPAKFNEAVHEKDKAKGSQL